MRTEPIYRERVEKLLVVAKSIPENKLNMDHFIWKYRNPRTPDVCCITSACLLGYWAVSEHGKMDGWKLVDGTRVAENILTYDVMWVKDEKEITMWRNFTAGGVYFGLTIWETERLFAPGTYPESALVKIEDEGRKEFRVSKNAVLARIEALLRDGELNEGNAPSYDPEQVVEVEDETDE